MAEVTGRKKPKHADSAAAGAEKSRAPFKRAAAFGFGLAFVHAAVIHRFAVGPYSVRVTVPRDPSGFVSAVCEWQPCVPDRDLSASECDQYELGLQQAVLMALIDQPLNERAF